MVVMLAVMAMAMVMVVVMVMVLRLWMSAACDGVHVERLKIAAASLSLRYY
jgi:hypothetical protein